MGKALYLADKDLSWLKGSTMPAAPATIYIAAMATLSTLQTQGTEASGGSYARVAITTTTGLSAIAYSSDGLIRLLSNVNDVVFPTPSADWGEIVGWEALDSATLGAGNRLYWGELNPHQFVQTGQVFKILAGQLVIGES